MAHHLNEGIRSGVGRGLQNSLHFLIGEGKCRVRLAPRGWSYPPQHFSAMKPRFTPNPEYASKPFDLLPSGQRAVFPRESEIHPIIRDQAGLHNATPLLPANSSICLNNSLYFRVVSLLRLSASATARTFVSSPRCVTRSRFFGNSPSTSHLRTNSCDPIPIAQLLLGIPNKLT